MATFTSMNGLFVLRFAGLFRFIRLPCQVRLSVFTVGLALSPCRQHCITPMLYCSDLPAPAQQASIGVRPLWIIMTRTILLLCCWLLMPAHYANAANSAAQAAPAASSASRPRGVAPLIIPASKAAAKPAVKSSSIANQPASKAKQLGKSAPTPRAKPAKAVKSAAKPVKPAQIKAKRAGSSAAHSQLKPIKLNLSLPPAQLKGMTFGKPLAEVAETPLLPPMFGEAKPEPSAYQLTGKLITSERQAESADFFNSVEGAQLSIEFRQ